MKVADLIKNSGSTGFSFEILPPLKGSSIEKSFKAIDTLREFAPLYIRIPPMGCFAGSRNVVVPVQ